MSTQPQVYQIGDGKNFYGSGTAQNAVDRHFKADHAEKEADESQVSFSGRNGLGRGSTVQE